MGQCLDVCSEEARIKDLDFVPLQLSVCLKKRERREFGIAVPCSFCCLLVVPNQSAVEVGNEQRGDAHCCALLCWVVLLCSL